MITLQNNYPDHVKSNLSKNLSLNNWVRTVFKDPNKKKNCYLAGCMEFDKGWGADWRNVIEKRLVKNGFDVFNPAEKNKLNGELALFDKCEKHELKYSEVKKWAYNIIQTDLSALLESDVILCNWIMDVPTYGTPAELTVAKMFNIPVILVCNCLDYTKIPKWVLGCCDYLCKDMKNIIKDIKKVLSIKEAEDKEFVKNNLGKK